jgi:hypothetical protein
MINSLVKNGMLTQDKADHLNANGRFIAIAG